jgi:hypothetical protein
MNELDETFTMSELKEAVDYIQRQYRFGGRSEAMVNGILSLSLSLNLIMKSVICRISGFLSGLFSPLLRPR